MLDMFGTPTASLADVQVFNANSVTQGANWVTWTKPRGVTNCTFIAFGAGGSGGNGAVGAVSAAAGGGGGSASPQAYLSIPAILLPDVLFISVPYGPSAPGTVGNNTYVSIYPDTTLSASNLLLISGSTVTPAVAGSGSGVTPGAAGAARAIGTIAMCPLAGIGAYQFIAGAAGIIGSAGAGAALTLPTTGLMQTGGSGGGGVPATATAGNPGGGFTVAGAMPPHIGGLGGSSATTPGGNGSNGLNRVFRGLGLSYGGTGGGSSHGSATGAGLFGGNGGSGGIGSGGGGGGGCLTGGTAGLGGKGGDGQLTVICY